MLLLLSSLIGCFRQTQVLKVAARLSQQKKKTFLYSRSTFLHLNKFQLSKQKLVKNQEIHVSGFLNADFNLRTKVDILTCSGAELEAWLHSCYLNVELLMRPQLWGDHRVSSGNEGTVDFNLVGTEMGLHVFWADVIFKPTLLTHRLQQAIGHSVTQDELNVALIKVLEVVVVFVVGHGAASVFSTDVE